MEAEWLLPDVVVFSDTSSLSVHNHMSTTSGYGVVDVSHVAIFSNFGGTVSVIILGWDFLLDMEV